MHDFEVVSNNYCTYHIASETRKSIHVMDVFGKMRKDGLDQFIGVHHLSLYCYSSPKAIRFPLEH